MTISWKAKKTFPEGSRGRKEKEMNRCANPKFKNNPMAAPA